jgi:hypothetical protein
MQFETKAEQSERSQVLRMFPEFLTKMTKEETQHKHCFVRRAAVMQATPKGALSGVISRSKRIHARGLTVDHIVPIWGVNDNGDHVVCGLNVAWNLRGESFTDNCKKGSKFVDNADAIAIILPPKQKSA